jgi:hypothetical protein
MSDEKLTEDELDAVFHAAQHDPVAPSQSWLARVADDAERALNLPDPAPQPTFWAQISSALGGWQGFGGMAVACATGLWIGIAPPDLLGDPVGMVLENDSTIDVLSDAPFEFAGLLDEG